jgi:hypothetical protein
VGGKGREHDNSQLIAMYQLASNWHQGKIAILAPQLAPFPLVVVYGLPQAPFPFPCPAKGGQFIFFKV